MCKGFLLFIVIKYVKLRKEGKLAATSQKTWEQKIRGKAWDNKIRKI